MKVMEVCMEGNDLKGLGGWLTILGLGLALGIIAKISGIIVMWNNIYFNGLLR
jgi:hypothetical protein